MLLLGLRLFSVACEGFGHAERVDHAAECVYEFVDFVARLDVDVLLEVVALVEVAEADFVGDVREFLERFGDAFAHDDGEGCGDYGDNGDKRDGEDEAHAGVALRVGTGFLDACQRGCAHVREQAVCPGD